MGGLVTDRKHLVEVLDRGADNHGLSLHAAHQELEVLLKGLLVLDEAHGHVIVGVTGLQLLQEAATKGTVSAPPSTYQSRPSLEGQTPYQGLSPLKEYGELCVQEAHNCVATTHAQVQHILYVHMYNSIHMWWRFSKSMHAYTHKHVQM